MLKQNRLLKANLREAVVLNDDLEVNKKAEKAGIAEAKPSTEKIITISSENGKEQLNLSPEKLLFISAAENYVEVY